MVLTLGKAFGGGDLILMERGAHFVFESGSEEKWKEMSLVSLSLSLLSTHASNVFCCYI
jgi:hypothetical protein